MRKFKFGDSFKDIYIPKTKAVGRVDSVTRLSEMNESSEESDQSRKDVTSPKIQLVTENSVDDLEIQEIKENKSEDERKEEFSENSRDSVAIGNQKEEIPFEEPMEEPQQPQEEEEPDDPLLLRFKKVPNPSGGTFASIPSLKPFSAPTPHHTEVSAIQNNHPIVFGVSEKVSVLKKSNFIFTNLYSLDIPPF